MKLCLIVFLILSILSAVICKSCNCKCCSKNVDWSEPDPTDSNPTTEHTDSLVEFTKVGGLNFMPKPENSKENNTLIRYNPDDANYVRKSIQQYFKKYTTNLENTVDCGHPRYASETRPCVFKLDRFGPCEAPDFGLKSDSLCVFLELDKVENWQPQYYNASSTIPEGMPDEVKSAMEFYRGSKGNWVWVDCTAKDENGAGVPVGFLPERGFHSTYFPYSNVEGYHNPVVAIHFRDPRSCTVIDLVCRAWAKNIHHEKKQGVVNFQVFVDKNCTAETVELEN